MSNSIFINEAFLTFKGSVVVELKYSVKSSLIISDMIFLVLNIPSEHFENRNVVCYNMDGKLIWNIIAGEYPREYCPVTGISEIDNQLVVYRRCGIEEVINIESGVIISSELIK